MSYLVTTVKVEHSPIIRSFKVNPESCENPTHYEEYLIYNALNDIDDGKGLTYLFLDENDDNHEQRIMGFVTLKASSLIKEGELKKLGEPALEISELAVDVNYERQGIGSKIIAYVIDIAKELNKTQLGIRYLLLCADRSAVGFYEKVGFKKQNSCYEIPRENWNQKCVPMGMKLKH